VVRTLLAAAPLLVVLGLMIGLRWRAGSAGLTGLLLAVVLAVTVFGLGGEGPAGSGAAATLGGAGLEAAFTTATILWIVFPALALYELQARSGQLQVLRAAIARLSDNPRTQVLFVAWFFGTFMEGASGFGAPVALAAPFLVLLGQSPVRAVVLALIGHGAGVSFGALGTPVLAQAAMLPLDVEAIARQTALLNIAVGGILLAALVWLGDDKPPTPGDMGRGALAGLCFYAPYGALAAFAGPELPSLGGGALGVLLFAAVARQRSGARSEHTVAELIRAAAPYFLVIALVLLTRGIGPLRDLLQSVELSWRVGGDFHGAVRPLYHTGTLLLAALLLGALLQRRSRGDLVVAAGSALRRLAIVAGALFVMLFLSRVMVHGGLMAQLGAGAAAAGLLWPLLAPALGATGSFVTGSATASNILLTPFQAAAAEDLHLPAARMAAAQGLGASFGNIVCPHNVIAGTAAVGLMGRDAEVLRWTAPVCAAGVAAAGILLLALSTLDIV
jgi:lactate permease